MTLLSLHVPHALHPAAMNLNALIKILFVCHGNICRSPMAEFVMKDRASCRAFEMARGRHGEDVVNTDLRISLHKN